MREAKPTEWRCSCGDPWSSVIQGLQRLSEKQQINVALSKNLSLPFVFVNLLLFFKTLKQAHISKQCSVAIRDPKPLVSLWNEDLGFWLCWHLALWGKGNSTFKNDFLSSAVREAFCWPLQIDTVTMNGQKFKGSLWAGQVGMNPNVYEIYMESILKSPTEITASVNREYIWTNCTMKNL